MSRLNNYSLNSYLNVFFSLHKSIVLKRDTRILFKNTFVVWIWISFLGALIYFSFSVDEQILWVSSCLVWINPIWFDDSSRHIWICLLCCNRFPKHKFSWLTCSSRCLCHITVTCSEKCFRLLVVCFGRCVLCYAVSLTPDDPNLPSIVLWNRTVWF